jgi:hypothetical protein
MQTHPNGLLGWSLSMYIRRSIASSGLDTELALHEHSPEYLIGQLDITFAREKARGSLNTSCSVVFKRSLISYAPPREGGSR